MHQIWESLEYHWYIWYGRTMSTNDTSGKKAFTVRVEADLARRLSVLAALESKSREQWIREVLEMAARRQEERNAGR